MLCIKDTTLVGLHMPGAPDPDFRTWETSNHAVRSILHDRRKQIRLEARSIHQRAVNLFVADASAGSRVGLCRLHREMRRGAISYISGWSAEACHGLGIQRKTAIAMNIILQRLAK